MPSYTANLLDADLIVGREGNHFAIEITPPADGWNEDEVCVRVSIPYGSPAAIALGTTPTGEEETYLLPDEEARPTVIYGSSAETMYPVEEGSELAPLESTVCWETWVDISEEPTIRIDVTAIAGNVPPGTAKVFIGIRTPDEEDFSKQAVEVLVTLAEGETGKPKIHYFDGTPDYVLHAGETEVVLSFYTTGAEKVTLFKNNVRVWPPEGGSTDLRFTDKPTITSVYRLEAAGENAPDRDIQLSAGDLVVRSCTVQVAQAGWNRQPLHQGYPTVLMAHKDMAGESDRLYGVFVNPTTEAVGLYSSATGFPPWKMESDFRNLSHMSHSPGVACGGKLWLIGGSSVDPTVKSNEVWYCHKRAETTKLEWQRATPGGFEPRMGHCVLEFKNKLWVLGGSNGTHALKDVWSCDPAGSSRWECINRGASWDGRCMFAAVATPSIAGIEAFRHEKIWIFGGTEDPDVIDAKNDLWSTTDGETWQEEKEFEFGPLPGQPNGATLLWDDDRLHLAGSFMVPTRNILQVLAREMSQLAQPERPNSTLRALIGDVKEGTDFNGATLSAMIYSLCPERYLWEANPVSWGWEQFGGDSFLMQSTVFQRFWFFWSLNQSITGVPKLNVFIPS